MLSRAFLREPRVMMRALDRRTYHVQPTIWARCFSQSHEDYTSEYYFVDTNIVSAYMKDEYPGLVSFVDAKHRHFFYTETVKLELDKPNPRLPYEKTPFHYCHSGLLDRSKNLALDLLEEQWTAHALAESSRYKQKFFSLSDKRMKLFRNDLLIILESGYACFDESVMPVGTLVMPYLLINNLRLYKKFLHEPQARELLETVVNQSGFEHLIEVKKWDEVVSKMVPEVCAIANPVVKPA